MEGIALTDLLARKLEEFEQGSPEYFICAALGGVQEYCGWHIAPSMVVTDVTCRWENGTIMLPSLHVTSVQSVVVDGRELDEDEYEWDAAGFITRCRPSWPRSRQVLVSFTHGYDELPHDVMAVVLEVAAKARSLPALPATEVAGGPFRIKLEAGSAGTAASERQKERLASYRIRSFG